MLGARGDGEGRGRVAAGWFVVDEGSGERVEGFEEGGGSWVRGRWGWAGHEGLRVVGELCLR